MTAADHRIWTGTVNFATQTSAEGVVQHASPENLAKSNISLFRNLVTSLPIERL
jgi:hypothetical protein